MSETIMLCHRAAAGGQNGGDGGGGGVGGGVGGGGVGWGGKTAPTWPKIKSSPKVHPISIHTKFD